MLAGGYDNGIIRLWDKNTGDLLKTLTASGQILSLAFDSNNVLASGSGKGTITLWGK